MTWHPKFVRRASCSSARKALSRSRSWRSWADSMASEATISTPSFCAFSARFRRFLRFSDQIIFSFRRCFDYTSAFKSLMCLLISVVEIGWLFSELKWLIPASNQEHVGLRLVEDGEDTLGDFYYYFEPKGDRIGSAFDPLWLSLQEVSSQEAITQLNQRHVRLCSNALGPWLISSWRTRRTFEPP